MRVSEETALTRSVGEISQRSTLPKVIWVVNSILTVLPETVTPSVEMLPPTSLVMMFTTRNG